MPCLPPFELYDDEGRLWTPESFKGKWTLLYFYPKDDTPGCTLQARSCQKKLRDWSDRGVQVVGVSADDQKSHQNFKQKWNLSFPLLCDPDHLLCHAMGLWKQKQMYGRKFWGIERSSFLIDPAGEIVWEKRNVSAEAHDEEVEKILATLVIN